WRDTWVHPAGGFWPAWLATDFPGLGIWSVEYDAAWLGWTGTAMPIVHRATNLLDLLTTHGLGTRPLCFIAHSMGGLIVKAVLRECADTAHTTAAHQQLLDHAQGILFLSTPHTGADLAKLAGYLGFF